MADSVNILSVFSGTGMFDVGVECALLERGFHPRVVGYVEREAAAAYTLLARMENTTLRRAPVWADGLEDLDARPLRGWVDLLTASPPCQPYSSAGKRLGNDDERSHGDGDGPLVHLMRIIGECEPTLVFFENVPEWVAGGHFREFGERLCGMGYDLAPPLFLASGDLGAPQRRGRVFVLGWLAERKRAGCGQVAQATTGPCATSELERERHQLSLTPPGRNDWRAWAAVAEVDPSRMPAVEPGLPVVADAVAPPASDLLRLGGNGVDPMVAAVAFGILLDRVGT